MGQRPTPASRRSAVQSQDVHRAGKSIGKHVQRHSPATRGSVFIRKWVAPIRALMCRRDLSAVSRRSRISPDARRATLDRLDNVLMLPSGDAPFLAGCAAVLDGAGVPCTGAAAQHPSILPGWYSGKSAFRRRAHVHVLRRHVAKCCLTSPPLTLLPEVCGLGSVTVTPASSHARICSLLKQPRSATTSKRSVSSAALVSWAMGASWATSVPKFAHEQRSDGARCRRRLARCSPQPRSLGRWSPSSGH